MQIRRNCLFILAFLIVFCFTGMSSAERTSSLVLSYLPRGWTVVRTAENDIGWRSPYLGRDGEILIDLHYRRSPKPRSLTPEIYINFLRRDVLSTLEGYKEHDTRQTFYAGVPAYRHEYSFVSSKNKHLRGILVAAFHDEEIITLLFYLSEGSYQELLEKVNDVLAQLTVTLVHSDFLPPPEAMVDAAPLGKNEAEIMSIVTEIERIRIAGDYASLLNLYADPYTFEDVSSGDTASYRIGEWAQRLRENLAQNAYLKWYLKWKHEVYEIRFPGPEKAVVFCDRKVRYLKEEAEEIFFTDRAEFTSLREGEFWKLSSVRILELY